MASAALARQRYGPFPLGSFILLILPKYANGLDPGFDIGQLLDAEQFADPLHGASVGRGCRARGIGCGHTGQS